MHRIPIYCTLLFIVLMTSSCTMFRNKEMQSNVNQERILPLILDVELDQPNSEYSNNKINPKNLLSMENLPKGIDVYLDVQNANTVDIELTSLQINIEKSQLKMPLNQILPAGQSIQMRYFVQTSQTPSLFQVYVQVLGKNILSDQNSVGVFQNELPPFPAGDHMEHHE
jgi:hypothetical protein